MHLLFVNSGTSVKTLSYIANSSMTLKDIEAVNTVLNTTINVITMTVESLYQKAQELDKKQQQLQTTNEGRNMAVELLNQAVRGLCGEPKDVCTCKVELSEYVQ